MLLGALSGCILGFGRFLCAGVLLALLGAASGHPAALAQSKSTPITIQPNTGAIDVSGGVQFAPNGRYLAIGNGTQIKLWDIGTGLPLRLLEHSAYFAWFAVIDGGARILSLHKDGHVRTWDPLTGKVLSSGEIPGVEPPMMSVAHHSESRLIAVAANAGSLIVWDYANGRQRAQIDFSADTNISIEAVQFSRDGTQLIAFTSSIAASGDASVRVVDLATRRVVRTTRLSRQGDLRPLALLNTEWLVAKTEWTDCRADVVLMRLAPGGPAPIAIDRAPGCQGGKDDNASLDSIRVVHDTRDDRLYVSRAGTPGFKIWDLATGRAASDVRGTAGEGWLVGIDRSLAVAALGDGQGLRIADLGDWRTISTLAPGHGASRHFAIASADGQQIMLHQSLGAVQHLTVWPVGGITPRFHSVTLPPGFEALHAVPDANLLLGSDGKSRFVLHSIVTGERLSAFSVPGLGEVGRARLSPDGRWILMTVSLAGSSGSDRSATYLVEARTGKIARKLRPRRYRWEGAEADPSAYAGAFAFSADGKRFAVAWWSFGVEIWSLEPLRLIRGMDAPQATALAFSADGKTVAVGSRDEGVYTFSAETGRKLSDLARDDLVAGHVSTGSVAVSADGALMAAGPGQRAVSSGDIGAERRVQVWNAASGKMRYLLSGHEANVNALVFTADGRWLVSGSSDGTIRYWSRGTGALAATFAAAPDGRWVIVTDKGFFAGSANAGNLMSVVRGFDATHIDRLRQSLYAPDLVRSYLVGDPGGEVAAAEAHKDLAAILDSAPTPTVRIVLPIAADRSTADIVAVTAHIADRGKGVGRIEWRVNGVTAAVAAKPKGDGPAYTVTKELALDPGDNTIEVVAYNGSNLLASLPARSSVKFTGSADKTRPKLHILAIGINEYVDRGWAPAGAQPKGFGPLALAVKDATVFAASLNQAAAGLYDEVRVTLALDKDATRDNLNKLVDKLAAEIHPRDSFILFAAAHGKSENGRFYLIPQDYQSGPGHLARHAIGQDDLQDWLGNRIKARKAVVLLDTCESGALIAGHARSRIDAAITEASVGRLHEATGRPVLTAAAADQEAAEGEIGATGERHGYFTWAVLDALRKGDTNGNGLIELSELVAHVQDVVPKIAAKKGIRGLATISVADKQSARFGSRGEDYALVQRLK
jgi:WD40 repeat protein